MQINDTGHVVNSKGITTTPDASPYWLGDDAHRVAFDFLVLDDGWVALHANYGNILRQCRSEFFYDIIECDNALVSAQSLIRSATSIIQAHSPDIEIDTVRADDFLLAVARDIVKHKKPAFYLVDSN